VCDLPFSYEYQSLHIMHVVSTRVYLHLDFIKYKHAKLCYVKLGDNFQHEVFILLF